MDGNRAGWPAPRAPTRRLLRRAVRLGALLALLALLPAPAGAITTSPDLPVPWYRMDERGQPQVILYFFWSERCPHCREAVPFVNALLATRPWLVVASHELSRSAQSQLWFMVVAAAAGGRAGAVPTFIACGRAWVGFDSAAASGAEVARLADGCHAEVRTALGLPVVPAGPARGARLTLPGLGTLSAEALSLPVLTLVLGGLDAFNPCAFFVLLFLLSLMVHARSRARMALVGGVFVLTSGVVYFAFMAAWLNAFLLLRGLGAVTVVAGLLALALGALNIKDFVWLRLGPTLSVPQSRLQRLGDRMRGLLQADHPAPLLLGTLALAVAANSYELLCTSGFPLVYTRVLTLHGLPEPAYYAYLAAYNAVYVLPLLAIVTAFVATLGRRRLGEREGRALKLLSGLMMAGLGALLLAAPHLLERIWAALAILAGAAALTALALLATRRPRPPTAPTPQH